MCPVLADSQAARATCGNRSTACSRHRFHSQQPPCRPGVGASDCRAWGFRHRTADEQDRPAAGRDHQHAPLRQHLAAAICWPRRTISPGWQFTVRRTWTGPRCRTAVCCSSTGTGRPLFSASDGVRLSGRGAVPPSLGRAPVDPPFCTLRPFDPALAGGRKRRRAFDLRCHAVELGLSEVRHQCQGHGSALRHPRMVAGVWGPAGAL